MCVKGTSAYKWENEIRTLECILQYLICTGLHPHGALLVNLPGHRADLKMLSAHIYKHSHPCNYVSLMTDKLSTTTLYLELQYKDLFTPLTKLRVWGSWSSWDTQMYTASLSDIAPLYTQIMWSGLLPLLCCISGWRNTQNHCFCLSCYTWLKPSNCHVIHLRDK